MRSRAQHRFDPRALYARYGERVELWTVALILLVAAALWAFVALAGEVLEGDTHAIDQAILLALRTPGQLDDPLGPGWVEELGRDFTALGGVGVLACITLAVAGYFRIQRLHRAMWLMLVAVGGGLVLSTLLKMGFDRPRPELVPHGSIVYTASFPSGHSMMAAVTYLTLAVLLARVQERMAVKSYVLTVAVLVTLAVGTSRVYLGVHWPTDVLAGWTVGAAWALFVWLVTRWLQRRGQVEGEGEGA
ncbi:phosphatase PAP2 family protein [Ramlibacter rhizophilus]|uniref:Phosphatase PAP2 family protein n=1 Tax=Ramlibacter rhizophilus TaxID=1781167 RepID=A0A4Z0BT97_9BURK|nr:phosphatase PAP2 family protein [Ramlibacter rhizophilus]TFZ01660.1 phosphatase PAP2 family protein [Ramlibacter rhizophilus]